MAEALTLARRAADTLDALTSIVAPSWTLRRIRARGAGALVKRHYEAASVGRRTSTWNRTGADANSALGPALAYLRAAARDLVRNNPYAESALSTIADHAVGWGITAKPKTGNAKVAEVWRAWAESTDCDADGVNDLAGLQKLAMRTVVESGEAIIRRRWRRLEDGFALPVQIQILEPDFLDTSRDVELGNGARIVQGVEFDALGRRVAYWLFREHPGASLRSATFGGVSSRVPATDVIHLFKSTRAGQARAASWFAPVLLKLKDFDEFDDASLMKQKIAACLAVITSDVDGTDSPLGAVSTDDPLVESLEPGMIANIRSGRSVDVVQPPATNEYGVFTSTQLRAIATGLGVTYEDLTGDYAGMPFSAARMSRLRHWARVDDWRYRMLIPRMCDPVWGWAMRAAVVGGMLTTTEALDAAGRPVRAEWTAPPMPMVDPAAEGLAYKRNIRAGIMTLPEAIRERGYNPSEVFDEIERTNAELDKRGIVLDCDPRVVSEAGQKHPAPAAEKPAGAAPAGKADTGDGNADDTADAPATDAAA